MPEDVPTAYFVTKRLIIKEDNTDRFFEGILSVEMKDRQGEITSIDELYKALPIWMERGAPMSDTHSNRIVGRGINFERITIKTDNGITLPGIKILGKIHSNTALDDFIWKQITTGVYKGLSFGGATKADRTPVIQSDGSMAYALKDLEIYEVAVCEDPAVAFALITDINPMAKSVNKAFHVEKEGEKLKIKCDGTACYVNATVQKAGYGSQAEELNEPKDVTKPLPTKWGKMEFEACESHASKDPSIKNPGGYCGSIQSGVEKTEEEVEKATPVHVGQKEFGSTDQCISAQSHNGKIRDAEAYCGSRHNDEHGMNPNDDKHKANEGQTTVGNGCDAKASCSHSHDMPANLEEVEKPKDKGCTCKDIKGIGQENPRGLGAYNTTVNGTGSSNQIVDPARLGDPEKLENNPKKPKDPMVKSMTSTTSEWMTSPGEFILTGTTSDTIFINPYIKKTCSNMTEDKDLDKESKKADEEPEKEKENPFEKKAEDDKKDEDKETNKAILAALKSISDNLIKQNAKIDKAMEKPTDLPLSPSGGAASEDVGAKVSVPDKYQSNSHQSGIQDANGKVEDKPESDAGDLKMQEKSYRTTSPVERPTGYGHSDLAKSTGKEDALSFQILQKCRKTGYENLSVIGKSLLDIADRYDREGVL